MTFHRSGAAAGRSRDTASLDFSARIFALLIACVATVSAGCNADGFELPVAGSRGDGGGEGDGGGDIDADPSADGDAGPDATPPDDACPIAPEVCDGQDNDCDGDEDEGFNLDEDPANCGECGHRCELPNTLGSCDLGECVYECTTGHHNLDGDMDGDNDMDMDATDQLGCEYTCIPNPSGVLGNGDEICNRRDDDCDGQEDEDTDLDSDEANCGGCGIECNPLHSTADCQAGECGYTDDGCDPGFADFSDAIPGCEYTCPENPPLAEEQCDGEDDNCNGEVDEQPITGFGDDCAGGTETGACDRGINGCFFGSPVCQGRIDPQAETCNGIDDDCNGVIDNGFNKQTDENNCGTCGHVCDDIPNAVEQCTTGTCQIFQCKAGFVDSDGDGDPVEGCDYQCTKSGPEVCDGVDNDCDKLIDGADPQMTTPANFCRTQGECGTPNTVPTCRAAPNGCTAPDAAAIKWRCVYTQASGNVETDSCGKLLLQEQDCDGLDGDCDTRIDEGQVLKGAACNDEDEGECLDTGTYVCASDPGDVSSTTGLTCNAVDTDNGVGSDEVCNDLDDDCDADVDEDAPDEVVLISDGAGPLADFYIQAYEASRPNATDSSSGGPRPPGITCPGGGCPAGSFCDSSVNKCVELMRTCSNPDVLPWRLVSRVDAAAACAVTGKQLCSTAQWELACNRLIDEAYPYDDTANNTANYEPLTCNGRDYDADSGQGGNQDEVIATGELDQCTADWGAAGDVFDLSGNLKEWTRTQVGTTGAYRVRGGSYDNIEEALTCDFSFLAFDEDIELPNLGFRCCSATP